jgi:25S rRNA (adenine2142-N1)-methyltransferase
MVNKRSCARKWPLTSSLTGSPRQRAHPAVSSKVTQSTISAFHTLRKRRTQLQRQLEHAKGTSREELSEKARRVDADIDELGGIDAYQKASQLGQSSIRGGDSSKVLVAWLHATRYDREAGRPGTGKKASKETDVLEGQDQQCRKLK